MSCVSCTLRFTSVMRRPVTCHKCMFQSCQTCFLRWVSQSPTHGCMQCKHVFDVSFIFANVSPAGRRTYDMAMATHKAESERAMLPYMAATVSNIIEADSIRLDIHKSEFLLIDLVAEQRKLKLTHKRLTVKLADPAADAARRLKLAEVAAKSHHTLATTRLLTDRLEQMRQLLKHKMQPVTTNVTASRSCPRVSPPCAGFITADNVCNLCAGTVCATCGVIAADEHVCNPDDVASIALLANDTKLCPKCNVVVFRASGCMQMWCTRCHVNFDWRSLRILPNNTGHNPDRTAYMNRNGVMQRGDTDMLCNVLARGFLPPNRIQPSFSRLQFGVGNLDPLIVSLRPNDDAEFSRLRVKLAMSGYEHPVTKTQYATYTNQEHIADIYKIIVKSRRQNRECEVLTIMYAGMLSLLGELETRHTYPDMIALRKLCNRSLRDIHKELGGTRRKLTYVHVAYPATLGPMQYLTYAAHREL